MPRIPSCGHDEVTQIILAAKDHILHGQDIVPPSDAIWTNLSEKLGGRMTPKAVYTFTKMNRHDIGEKLGLQIDEHPEEFPSSDDFHSDTIVLQLQIHFQEWKEQFLEEALYQCSETQSNERRYSILKPSWTRLLSEKIWKAKKSECTLSFKRAKVHPNSASRCIIIDGHCTECKATLQITSETLPKEHEPVILECSLEQVNKSLHSGKGKRHLAGEERVKVSEELWRGKELPHVWRAAKDKKLMSMGDPEPSHLPSLPTLRKAKQDRIEIRSCSTKIQSCHCSF